ncbi:MAG: DUF447 family protein [Candidatus Lokiarchaeota archaeon]|nr:DUF447 family protein [Candidatus Lokiarchaeota archaeon]
MGNLQDYGLNQDYLYEVLASTISKKDENEYPNTASMGISVIDDRLLKIKPYNNTVTHENLKEYRFVSLNFIEEVELFAQASLKKIKSGFNGIPIEDYLYYEYSHRGEDNRIPYLKQAWMVIFCSVVNETQIVKQDNMGTISATEFELEVIYSIKKKESFKLYNRAENLALESIILATRLKIARNNKDDLLYSKIESKINDYFDMITKFGKNSSALKAINLVKDYIKVL